MNTQKQTAPNMQGIDGTGVNATKVTQKTFSNNKRRLINLLSTGSYAVSDISKHLSLCDPRGHIRDLIHSGVVVYSRWTVSSNKVRYKLYSLKPFDNVEVGMKGGVSNE